MGNKSSGGIKLDEISNQQKATSLLSPAMEDLQKDWAKAIDTPLHKINWKKTEANYAQFAKLMDSNWDDKDLKAVFALYDFDGNCKISWKEYICVCALIMGGTADDKIKLLFATFDDDGNGELSKKEFTRACKEFSKKNY